MCIKNRFIALVYRVIFFLIGIITLIYDFGFFNGIFKKINLLYFTILSNLFCSLAFLGLIIKTILDIQKYGIKGSSSISPHIKGGVMLYILLTMSVYHFILIPYALHINPYQRLRIPDVVFHYIIPFAMLFDWLMFDEKGKFKLFDPFIWISTPYIYVTFIFFQSRFELVDRINAHISRYVYIFLDISSLGIDLVIKNILSLTVVFLIVGYLIIFVDRIRIE